MNSSQQEQSGGEHWLLPRKTCRIVAWTVAMLCVVEILLVVGSWIAASLMPYGRVHSLLTGDGLRWIVGSLVSGVRGEPLVWIVIVSMTCGLLCESRLNKAICSSRRLNSVERRALTLVVYEMLLVLVIVALLTLVPHAVLLSAVGSLFPSSFSHGLVPLACASLTMAALTYGSLTGSIRSMDAGFNAAVRGLVWASPLIVIYIMTSGVWRTMEEIFEF